MSDTADFYDEIYREFMQGDHISRMPLWEGIGLGLIVPVYDADILARMVAIQYRIVAALNIPAVALDTAHVTVRSCGRLTDEPASPWKISPADLPALIVRLTDLLRDVPCFDIALHRISSFFVCPIVEAHDDGAIGRIRARLVPGLAGLGLPDLDYGRYGFVPHLTLAYYSQNGDGAAARQIVTALRDETLGVLHVEALSLVKAQMREQLCCLETVHQFNLARKH